MLGNLASNKTTLLIYPSSRPPTLLSLSGKGHSPLYKLSSIINNEEIWYLKKKKKKKKKQRERDSILYKLFTLRRTLDILIPASKNFSNQTSYI